ncbi:PhnD/SsuA/transferrin family substrate-binding protein [Cupriavidus sp.]|uniref:phosphate/phosphite/phosphonate ABC transporter substrate-binding protein n=1 Tax=Cupriavidus sp. TaxID=1873897 RepID=UPI0025B81D45|nr:PhnD/SsuA/transferrin family substrate-binding protein [Cupriavidus sp.]MCA3192004.1 PhnD/SsuA/transferrin family substrate-binding protein [Cupriavidus sp.]MCA3197749.1 PhnD/SsuA/transferrin family substrate-binding protein [Cupriavidus sp.]MCA3202801.1 PhnD/SsuA/transferrin family substrate-binding protein [Cupriavidus sp.]MCA3207705.1 PhnD/SsuA/transferrin family substrate-binding protein [Cupriavidus sp.]MCA3233322.1 PhnD/SsuA/transferrin family substrate-binding protein [Cupriavidus sp
MAAGIASFRMYNATPAVTDAWHALFSRVFADLSWPVEVVPFAWPAPLPSLWQRSDLVCGFMCGLPFAQGMAPVAPLVAPVPSPAAYGGLPRYRSELLVRADSGWQTVEDTFGHRFGWMARHSQSGYHAARQLLAPFASKRGALFSESIGPLDTPIRALTALRERQIDVTALDSYFLDLVRRHEPALLDGLMTIAWTPWTPNPLLVASADLAESERERLIERLCGLHADGSYGALLDAVLVERFVRPEVGGYGGLVAGASGAERELEIR